MTRFRRSLALATLALGAVAGGCARNASHCCSCGRQLRAETAVVSQTTQRPPAIVLSTPSVQVAPLPPTTISPPAAPVNPPTPHAAVAQTPPTRENDWTGQAGDYRWLIGELQYVQVRDAWRLRYAAAEEEDRYGGSVTLLDTGTMAGFVNGQRVRVEGELVDAESHEPSPPYRLKSIQALPIP